MACNVGAGTLEAALSRTGKSQGSDLVFEYITLIIVTNESKWSRRNYEEDRFRKLF